MSIVHSCILVLLLHLIQIHSVEVNINANNIVGSVSPFMVGAGIEDVNHELYGGIYIQEIFGEGFEEPSGKDGISGSNENLITWQQYSPKGSQCSFSVSNTAYTGAQSQQISGTECGIINRGLDTQGMYLVSGREYSGSAYVHASASATLNISLVDVVLGQSVQTSISVQANTNWQLVTFNLTSTFTSSCGSLKPITPCVGNPENECISCTGGFVISVDGSVLVDQVYLHIASDTDTSRPVFGPAFQEIGFSILRLGGSMVNCDGYRWKRFQGPALSRQPYNGVWYQWESSGWGIFEFLEFTEAQGLLAVVTINNEETTQDMSDFIEYVYGNASTQWGAARVKDGHPEPYLPFWVEIGNEQNPTSQYIQDVAQLSAAMAQKAAALQLPFTLSFCVGATWDFTQLSDSIVTSIVKNSISVDADFYWDFHVPGDLTQSSPQQPAGPQLQSALEYKRTLITSLNPRFRAVVLEENGGTHSIARVLGHVITSNVLQRLGDFVLIDSCANCLQAFGHNDNAWDQGQVFYLPNMTWFSPYGWSQQMISNTYQPFTIEVENDSSWNSTLDVIGVMSEKRDVVNIRVANFGGNDISTTFVVSGVVAANRHVEVQQISGPLAGVNPPSNPTAFVPRNASIELSNPSPVIFSIQLPAYSFTTFSVEVLV